MNKNVTSLLFYFGIAFLFLIIQTALWPKNLQNQGFFPQIIIPLLIYLFLYSSFIISFHFIFGITLLTTSTSSYSFLNLFIIYLFIYFFVFVSKNNYNWKKSKFFFISCFIWSLSFPFLLHLPLIFAEEKYKLPSFFFLLMSAFVTVGVSYFLFPLFNSLKNKTSIEYL